ncbi:hypothetical protein STFR1_10788 [Bacillus vallismortis]
MDDNIYGVLYAEELAEIIFLFFTTSLFEVLHLIRNRVKRL